MAPNPSTGLVTLPEAITSELAKKIGEISLCNQHADFEFGSASNSISTSPWAIACKPATEPSCADFPLHEHFPTKCLYFPFYLDQAPFTWLESLEKYSIDKWDQLKDQFTSNFAGAMGRSGTRMDLAMVKQE
jgi:hypothetical protein